MTRVVLIFAGPTCWDAEGRLGGNHTLPLAPEGEAAVRAAAAALPDPVTAVYAHRANEACAQAARIVAGRFGLRVRNEDDLASIGLGLWQGLTAEELRFRYPRVYDLWEENPLAVTPPEGESLVDAAARLQGGLRRILRRNRGGCVALALRPMSVHLAAGILRGDPLETVAAHLRDQAVVETIGVGE